MDLDEATAEVKKQREAVYKDLEVLAKKRQVTDNTFNKAQADFTAFQVSLTVRLSRGSCLLVAERPSNMHVYLRDGSAQTV